MQTGCKIRADYLADEKTAAYSSQADAQLGVSIKLSCIRAGGTGTSTAMLKYLHLQILVVSRRLTSPTMLIAGRGLPPAGQQLAAIPAVASKPYNACCMT